jgi:hypothetical protein
LWFQKASVRDHRRKRVRHFSTFSDVYMVDWDLRLCIRCFRMLILSAWKQRRAKKYRRLMHEQFFVFGLHSPWSYCNKESLRSPAVFMRSSQHVCLYEIRS